MKYPHLNPPILSHINDNFIQWTSIKIEVISLFYIWFCQTTIDGWEKDETLKEKFKSIKIHTKNWRKRKNTFYQMKNWLMLKCTYEMFYFFCCFCLCCCSIFFDGHYLLSLISANVIDHSPSFTMCSLYTQQRKLLMERSFVLLLIHPS